MSQTKKNTVDRLLADEAIIELYWKRDERAIEETDLKYRKYLYSIAYNIIHDEPDCEECLNDTYFGVWNRIPPARPNAFAAFIGKIMRNIAVDKYRHKTSAKRKSTELETSLDELGEYTEWENSIDEEVAIREVARILSAYLCERSEHEQLIFVCRYYYCDKLRDIAKMLKVSEATVYRELIALREGLRARLEEGGYKL